MKASFFKKCVRALSCSIRPVLMVATGLTISNTVQVANAEVHQIRERGRTLVEAESYSDKSSVGSPKAEMSNKCSGERYLGYFWANEWFELEVDVPKMLNYNLTFRASSETGTQVKIQRMDASGEASLLATLDIPATQDYTNFTEIHDTIIPLPTGIQKLRFLNTGDGADIDYITFTAGSEDDVVTVKPVENAGPDVNPMKGFGSSWWRENEDLASVGFQYIEWRLLEPVDDDFDWEAVEEVLNRAGTQGRHFILQFAVDWDDWGAKEPVGDSHYKGPDWLLKKVGEHRGPAFPDDPDSRISRATNYNHPVFIEEATEAIKALCDHFKDDPRTFVLQTGLVGYWGEWHTYPRAEWGPTDSTKKSILDAYLDNIGPDGLTQIRYPDEAVATPQSRMGYTNGSATPTEHGIEFGQEIEKHQLWKNGPVGGEWPPSIDDEYWQTFFKTAAGKSFLEQGGYSTMTPPEAKEIAARLPGWEIDDLYMGMHRRMGYNFQAKSVRHLVAIDDSRQTHIEVDLHNSGIAPFYKDWEVQLAILRGDTNEVVDRIKVDTDLRTLNPGQTIALAGSSTVKLDPRIRYQIGLRILQPDADAKKIAQWKLKARNVYVALANDVKVTEGKWDENHALQGGWNLLGDVQPRLPVEAESTEGPFFPFQGSFRPASVQKPE